MGSKAEEGLRNICNSDSFISLLRAYGIQSSDEFFDKYFKERCVDLRDEIEFLFSCHCGMYKTLFTKYYNSYEHAEDSLTIEELLVDGILFSGMVATFMEPSDRDLIFLDIGTNYEDVFRHHTKKNLEESKERIKAIIMDMYPKDGENLYNRVLKAVETGDCELDLLEILFDIEDRLVASDVCWGDSND